MAKDNCWEIKKCGRQPGGEKTSELGVCPASTIAKADGIHGGKNGGRCCWVIAGTFCGGKVQGSFVQKAGLCISCEFYKAVMKEEGKEVLNPTAIMEKLK